MWACLRALCVSNRTHLSFSVPWKTLFSLLFLLFSFSCACPRPSLPKKGDSESFRFCITLPGLRECRHVADRDVPTGQHPSGTSLALCSFSSDILEVYAHSLPFQQQQHQIPTSTYGSVFPEEVCTPPRSYSIHTHWTNALPNYPFVAFRPLANTKTENKKKKDAKSSPGKVILLP